MRKEKIYYKSSSVHKQEGIWVLNIKADSNYDAGFTHGTLLKLANHPLYKLVRNQFFILFIKTLVLAFKRTLAQLSVEKKYMEEIRGMSDASGVPYNVLFFINFSFDVFKKSIFCSSFNFFSPKAIIARNTDSYKWIALLALRYEVTVVYHVCINNSLHYTHVGLCFVLGVINGYNNSGVCVNNHLVLGARQQKVKNKTMPNILILRKVLEEANNISMAEEILKRYPLSYATTALITDAKNKKSFVFEATPEEHFFLTTSGSFQVCTMHFISKKMKPLSKGAKTGSEKRLSFLNLVLSKQSLLDGNEAISILKNTENGLKRNKGGYSLTNSGTFQSFVFYPLEDMVIIANGEKLPVSLTGSYIKIRFID